MTQLVVQPTGSNTDAQQTSSATTAGLASYQIKGPTGRWNGFRFPGVTVPKGATITAAKLSLYCHTTIGKAMDTTVYGQAADNPTQFATGATGGISGRSRTSQSVTWSATFTEPAYNTSPTLKTIVQAIVTRSGWTSGNALALILNGLTATKTAAIWGFVHGSLYAKLTITYTTGTTASAGTGKVTVTAPSLSAPISPALTAAGVGVVAPAPSHTASASPSLSPAPVAVAAPTLTAPLAPAMHAPAVSVLAPTVSELLLSMKAAKVEVVARHPSSPYPTKNPIAAICVWATPHHETTPGSVVVLDAGTLSPVPGSPFAVGTDPNCAQVSPDGHWLAIGRSTETPLTGSVYLFDLSATPIAEGIEILTGGGTVGVNFSPDSKTLYVVASTKHTAISVINCATQTVTATIGLWPTTTHALPGQNISIFTDSATNVWGLIPGASAFPSTSAPHQAAVVKLSGTLTTPTIHYITVGAGPTCAAATSDGKTGFVCNYLDKTVSVLDLTPLPASPPTVSATTIPTSGYPYWIQVSPTGGIAYVLCPKFTGGGSITEIDLTTKAVTHTITATLLGPVAGGFNPSGSEFFSATTTIAALVATDPAVAQIAIIDTATRTVTSKIPQAGVCAGAAVQTGSRTPGLVPGAVSVTAPSLSFAVGPALSPAGVGVTALGPALTLAAGLSPASVGVAAPALTSPVQPLLSAPAVAVVAASPSITAGASPALSAAAVTVAAPGPGETTQPGLGVPAVAVVAPALAVVASATPALSPALVAVTAPAAATTVSPALSPAQVGVMAPSVLPASAVALAAPVVAVVAPAPAVAAAVTLSAPAVAVAAPSPGVTTQPSMVAPAVAVGAPGPSSPVAPSLAPAAVAVVALAPTVSTAGTPTPHPGTGTVGVTVPSAAVTLAPSLAVPLVGVTAASPSTALLVGPGIAQVGVTASTAPVGLSATLVPASVLAVAPSVSVAIKPGLAAAAVTVSVTAAEVTVGPSTVPAFTVTARSRIWTVYGTPRTWTVKARARTYLVEAQSL